MKYGIGSLCGYGEINPKLLEKIPSLNSIEHRFKTVAHIASGEKLPEMEFETIECAINVLTTKYIDDVYKTGTGKDAKTKIYYIIADNYNIIAILNYDKIVYMNKEIVL